MAAQSVGSDGIPIFNMYVKSQGGGGIWYPCGSFKGDERTKVRGAKDGQGAKDGGMELFAAAFSFVANTAFVAGPRRVHEGRLP